MSSFSVPVQASSPPHLAAGPYGQPNHAFSRQPTGEYIDLGTYGENTSISKINNRGQMMGGYFDGTRTHVVLFQPGGATPQDLGCLGTDTYTYGGGINEDGVVVGSSYIDGGALHRVGPCGVCFTTRRALP